MKLTKCDACGKIFRTDEVGTLKFEEGSGACVMVKSRLSNDYINICSTERDICRSCAIPILKIICPKAEFLPEEKYEEYEKR